MQRQISNLFKIASRPVITARPDERKRLQAEKVIQDMILKLEKRLPKMPFPPNTNETDFDLERVVERNVGVLYTDAS
jgi:kinetochore protein Fta7